MLFIFYVESYAESKLEIEKIPKLFIIKFNLYSLNILNTSIAKKEITKI